MLEKNSYRKTSRNSLVFVPFKKKTTEKQSKTNRIHLCK